MCSTLTLTLTPRRQHFRAPHASKIYSSILTTSTTTTMNTPRLLRPRTLRPHLSNRYRTLRRYDSTAPRPTAKSSSPPTPSLFRRYRAAITWSALAALLGFGTGSFAVHLIVPPQMPLPGTHEDNILIADLNRRIDDLFKVKVLRGKCLGVTKQLKGDESGWVEVLPASGERLPFHDGLVDQLQGAKGLGVQRVFWERGEKKLVAIVWFGGSLSGWPGVVHGGLLATALEDKVALAANLAHSGGMARVEEAAAVQRLPGSGNHATMAAPGDASSPDPVQFSIDYKKPTRANEFYVIRVTPAYSEEMQRGVRLGIFGAEWTATVETMDAEICVKAAAKFEKRSTAEHVEEKVVDAAKWTYEEFRQWQWPSRQRETMGQVE